MHYILCLWLVYGCLLSNILDVSVVTGTLSVCLFICISDVCGSPAVVCISGVFVSHELLSVFQMCLWLTDCYVVCISDVSGFRGPLGGVSSRDQLPVVVLLAPRTPQSAAAGYTDGRLFTNNLKHLCNISSFYAGFIHADIGIWSEINTILMWSYCSYRWVTV